MIITRQPPAIHAAFNSIFVSVQLQDGDPAFEEVRVKITCNGKEYRTYGDFLGGIATVDLSGCLKRVFSDREQPTVPDTGYTHVSSLLCAEYKLSFDIEGSDFPQLEAGTFTALNAAVQTGRSVEITGDRFLTAFRSLKKYEGYPLEVAFLNADRATYVNLDDITVNPGAPISAPHFVIDIPDSASRLYCTDNTLIEHLTASTGELLTTDAGEYIYARNGNIPENPIPADIEHPCTPSSPFYVRWVNDSGGWEHYMFSHRQIIEKSTESGMMAYPFIYDNENAKGYALQSYLEALEKVTAGVSTVPAGEYEIISKIIYSPEIEWYREDIGKWLRLTVDSSIIRRDTRHASGSLEITFNLPEPQIQF
jgi:hypothetical protein